MGEETHVNLVALSYGRGRPLGPKIAKGSPKGRVVHVDHRTVHVRRRWRYRGVLKEVSTWRRNSRSGVKPTVRATSQDSSYAGLARPASWIGASMRSSKSPRVSTRSASL